jgi:hypothetical protein
LAFCDICGRRLDPGARFCDHCGRKIAVEEAAALTRPVVSAQIPYPYEPALGPVGPSLSRAPGESHAIGEKGPEVQVERKPAGTRAAAQPGGERSSSIPARGFHITRRALALSVAGVAVIAIIAVAFLSGAIVLPPLPRTATQSSSQKVTAQGTTVATQETSRALHVQISIEENPISLPNTQVISVTVLDPEGVAVYAASVHTSLVFPSGQNQTFIGLTDTNGHYSCSPYIIASSDNVGTFEVVVSATKDGYLAGQAETTFQATAPPS